MWQIAVYDGSQHEQFAAVRPRFALCGGGAAGRWRFAAADDPAAPVALRMRVEADHVRLDCRGVSGHVEPNEGPAFWAGKVMELALPAIFRIDEAWFEVREVAEDATAYLEPLYREWDAHAGHATAAGPDVDTIGRWLTSISSLHRMAASSPDFFQRAAQLALESTGLDAAVILVCEGARWRIMGSAVPHPEFGIACDAAALALIEERPEVWRTTSELPVEPSVAVHQRESLIVAPVRGDVGQVTAAVYGLRHGRGDNRRRGVRPLEARVVELLADAIGVGMARRAQEIESARQQVLLEQAFSPAVIEHLRRTPEALAGCTRDVTLLFADLRGYTALAEQMPPAEAYELLGDVMELLTQAVMDHGGVVIDYYGDGLSALWNAPLDLPEHTDMACTAALEMLEAMPAISARWRQRLGHDLDLGIGLHAGAVQVGNAGTRRRLKYGPRGVAVNIASRVQAATRQVDVPLLATDEVRRRLSGRFVTLKTCTARLPGLEQPMDLFTVFPATDGNRLQSDMERYASALAAFEGGDLDAAERTLSELLASGPATPAAFLADHAAALRRSALGRRAGDSFARSDAVIEIRTK